MTDPEHIEKLCGEVAELANTIIMCDKITITTELSIAWNQIDKGSANKTDILCTAAFLVRYVQLQEKKDCDTPKIQRV